MDVFIVSLFTFIVGMIVGFKIADRINKQLVASYKQTVFDLNQEKDFWHRRADEERDYTKDKLT